MLSPVPKRPVTAAPAERGCRCGPADSSSVIKGMAFWDAILWAVVYIAIVFVFGFYPTQEYWMSFHFDGNMWRNVSGEVFMVPLPIGKRAAALDYIYCLLNNPSTVLIGNLVNAFGNNLLLVPVQLTGILVFTFLAVFTIVRVIATVMSRGDAEANCPQCVKSGKGFGCFATFSVIFDVGEEFVTRRHPMYQLLMGITEATLLVFVGYFVGMNSIQHALFIVATVMMIFFSLLSIGAIESLEAETQDAPRFSVVAPQKKSDIGEPRRAYEKTARLFSVLKCVSVTLMLTAFIVLWVCILSPYVIGEKIFWDYDATIRNCDNNPTSCALNVSALYRNTLASYTFDRNTWLHPPPSILVVTLLVMFNQMFSLMQVLVWNPVANCVTVGKDKKTMSYLSFATVQSLYFLGSTLASVVLLCDDVLRVSNLSDKRLLLDCAGSPCPECSSTNYPYSFANVPTAGQCVAPANLTGPLVCP